MQKKLTLKMKKNMMRRNKKNGNLTNKLCKIDNRISANMWPGKFHGHKHHIDELGISDGCP